MYESGGPADPLMIDLLEDGKLRRVAVPTLTQFLQRLLFDAVTRTEGEIPLLLVVYGATGGLSDIQVVTSSYLIDHAAELPTSYELAKMKDIHWSKGVLGAALDELGRLAFRYQGQRIRLSCDPALLTWLQRHVRGHSERWSDLLDEQVEFLEAGRVESRRLGSLGLEVGALVEPALAEGERPLLLVKWWDQYRLVTQSHLIDLHKKPPARYAFAKMRDPEVQGSRLTFAHDGVRVELEGEAKPLLLWLEGHVPAITLGWSDLERQEVELLEAGKVERIRLGRLGSGVVELVRSGLSGDEVPSLIVRRGEDYCLATGSRLVDLRQKPPAGYEFAKIEDLDVSGSDLIFTYEGARIRLEGEGKALRRWLKGQVFALGGEEQRKQGGLLGGGTPPLSTEGEEVDFIEAGKLDRVRLSSLGAREVSLVESGLEQGETPRLIVRWWGSYWLATDSHLIDLQHEPPARYDLARISALQLSERELTFQQEGVRVSIRGGGRALLQWMTSRIRHLAWCGHEVEFVADSGSREGTKMWAELPAGLIPSPECVLALGAELPLVVLGSGQHGLLATPSALVKMCSQKPERYELHRIRDLTLSTRRVGFLRSKEVASFTYEGRSIDVPGGREGFWSLISRWPSLAQSQVVQPEELAGADTQSTVEFEFGCLVEGAEVSGTSMARYTKIVVPVLVRRPGPRKYCQPVTCPNCMAKLEVWVSNGTPSLSLQAEKEWGLGDTGGWAAHQAWSLL